MRDLAAQAGLVLSNVRLTEELRARLDDLRAAQKRLVAAQDDERRKLERNIHDGAQQQLVALAVKARLARTLTERDPAKAAEMLAQIEAETQARPRRPAGPRPGHLPAAAGRQGPRRRARGPGEEVADPGRRSRPTASTACPRTSRRPCTSRCSKALQNVAKYAEATSATVSFERSNGELRFRVHDDGRGFDPSDDGIRHGAAGHRRPTRGARRRVDDRERAGGAARRSAGASRCRAP